MVYTLSELDKKILKGLKEDSRIPYTKLAKQLGIPDTTLHFHVKKMKEHGIIKKFTVIIEDYEKNRTFMIKLKVGGHIIADASIKKARMLGKELSEQFNFIGILEDKVTIVGLIKVKNEEELNKIVKNLERDPDIIKIEYDELEILKGDEFLNLESL
ncbi:MAG: Lrp/AsnC family transcriptional regulator [Candidatus Helarchaeota archaeon]